MHCAIWYHLYNLKNVKKNHEGVLLLESNTPPWVFFTFFKLYKWHQIAENITYLDFVFFVNHRYVIIDITANQKLQFRLLPSNSL